MLLYICREFVFIELKKGQAIMQIEIVRILGIIYISTWFVWPFSFVVSLIYGIASVINGETSKKYIVIAGISLLMMLSGFNLLLFS